MEIRDTGIPDVKILVPRKFGDDRGFFSETYNRHLMATLGFELEFIQDNHSLSRSAGVLRGLHFQHPPFAQDKLVRVVRGAVFDVAVDIRAGSPTFGQHVSALLSADNWCQLLVPAGFAHGFLTLEPDTEVIYKVTAAYSPEHDDGIAWDDPDLAIRWPLPVPSPTLSDKDRRLRKLREFSSPFRFAGNPS